MRISDWSSDVCSSDLRMQHAGDRQQIVEIEAPDQCRLHRVHGVADMQAEFHAAALRADFVRSDKRIRMRARTGADKSDRWCQACGKRTTKGIVEIDEIGRASCRERVCQYG